MSITSQNKLFPGLVIDKPRISRSRMVDATGEDIYQCPYCKNNATINQCDVGGAEPDCVFCNQCNREFEAM